jgi:hypothetical protein
VLPPLDPDTGLLPVGEHAASWDEVLDRFGWNEKRRGLLDGLADALDLLSSVGCRRVWINGSFVTAKDEPGDVDVCWDTEGVDLDRIDPIFLDLSRAREAQKNRFGCEFLPNVVEAGSGLVFAEFFQNDRDGSRKGIVVLDLKERQ